VGRRTLGPGAWQRRPRCTRERGRTSFWACLACLPACLQQPQVRSAVLTPRLMRTRPGRWMALLTRLNIKQPEGGVARTDAEAQEKARTLGFPVMVRSRCLLWEGVEEGQCVPSLRFPPRHATWGCCHGHRTPPSPPGPLPRPGCSPPPSPARAPRLSLQVRPSYVLGGRAMEIVYDDADLKRYITTAVEVDPEHPVLVDKYLDRWGGGGGGGGGGEHPVLVDKYLDRWGGGGGAPGAGGQVPGQVGPRGLLPTCLTRASAPDRTAPLTLRTGVTDTLTRWAAAACLSRGH